MNLWKQKFCQISIITYSDQFWYCSVCYKICWLSEVFANRSKPFEIKILNSSNSLYLVLLLTSLSDLLSTLALSIYKRRIFLYVVHQHAKQIAKSNVIWRNLLFFGFFFKPDNHSLCVFPLAKSIANNGFVSNREEKVLGSHSIFSLCVCVDCY